MRFRVPGRFLVDVCGSCIGHEKGALRRAAALLLAAYDAYEAGGARITVDLRNLATSPEVELALRAWLAEQEEA